MQLEELGPFLMLLWTIMGLENHRGKFQRKKDFVAIFHHFKIMEYF